MKIEGNVNLTSWGIADGITNAGLSEKFWRSVAKEYSDALNQQLRETPPHVQIDVRGHDPSDLHIIFNLPFGKDEDGIDIVFSLEEAIRFDWLDDDDSYKVTLQKVASGLRKLADRIDGVIAQK